MFFVLIVVAVVGVFLTFVALKPKQMHISRELLIRAEPEKLFPDLNHSRKMNEWMPWKDSDPGLEMNYSGPDEGVGSVSSWESKGRMGTGQAKIVESSPHRSVKTQLTYFKPRPMSQLAEVTLQKADGGTLVKWSVDGHNGFVFRLVGVFVNFDRLIGAEFERGLQKLRVLTETSK